MFKDKAKGHIQMPLNHHSVQDISHIALVVTVKSFTELI